MRWKRVVPKLWGCFKNFHQFRNSLNLFFDNNIYVNAQKGRPFYMPKLLDYPVNAISPWLVSHIWYNIIIFRINHSCMQNFILVLNRLIGNILAVDPCLGQYVWIRMTTDEKELAFGNLNWQMMLVIGCAYQGQISSTLISADRES